eukprot:CAMPEP_0196160066 /NCGR_PEP_ID=MMETSP0910-20130528/46639_1 /TAXON_ID=49265 /ORGANISM="Thalassiosira rotula, Strain GSO102" /LENGTH=143 /DNA_ID=CAMNT_0041424991 /DNA_START=546 /DNA_END=976 /DNA_ORIENTATION=-
MVASTRLNAEVVWGDYDDKMWDNDAKKDVYAKWDPTAPPYRLELAEVVWGDYDDKMWDNDAKKDVYAKWDPTAPRTGLNFNPFETFGGNSPDASGIYPGENRYKDPKRGDVSYAIMLIEKAEIEERIANPKAGEEPGCPGCKN